MRHLRLLTLNAGLLRGRGPIAPPAPYVEERATALPAAITELRPDVAVLQEVYHADHQLALVARLAPALPFSDAPRSSRILGSGLLTCSSTPLRGDFIPFRTLPWEERWFVSRGIQRVELAGALKIFNVHATAGGLYRHPESARMERCRDAQLAQIVALADRERGAVILSGDFNAGPDASRGNFERLLAAGWVDAGAEISEPTWDPLNPLNARGPHRRSPPQRIDHVLVRRTDVDTGRVRVRSARRCLIEPAVAVGTTRVTPSDHAGLLVELDVETW